MTHNVPPLLRVGWGVVLLAAPRLVLHAAGAPTAGRAPVLVARMLGARQVGQGLVTWGSDKAMVLRGGALVDGLHAASAVALAVHDPRWRRVGFRDALVASGFMATGLLPPTGERSPGKSRPAAPAAPSVGGLW